MRRSATRPAALSAVLVVAAAASVAASAAMSATTGGQPPNIVVLFIDDMGQNQVNVPAARDHGFVSYTGDSGTISTPNVAKLGEEGMVFQTWYSAFQVCSPSRAALLTGRLPVRVGIGMPEDKNGGPYPGSPNSGLNLVLSAEAVGGLPANESAYALSTLLRQAGYATMALGKWHLGRGYDDRYMPTNAGFDEYFGIPFSQDMGYSFWEGGWQTGMTPKQPFQPKPLPLVDNVTIVEQPVGLHTLAQRYTQRADAFIKANAGAHKPFFLYYPHNHVHGPNSCGPQFCNTSSRGAVGDAVQEADWAVGQVMQSLTDAGVDNNTIVFFTSDNGAPRGGDVQGNKPYKGYKTQLWEGGYMEPGIVRWPGRIPAKSASRVVASSMDILPTALAVAGVDMHAVMPAGRVIDGVDLSPVLFGPTGACGGHECYYYYEQAGPVGGLVGSSNLPSGLEAVRCGAYKAHWDAAYGATAAGPSLFDVSGTDYESTPIAPSDPRYAGAMAAITAARTAHLSSLTWVPSQNERGSDPALGFCLDPHSTTKYPKLPNCTSDPDNWFPAPVCGSAACRAANGGWMRRHCEKPTGYGTREG